jgi:hypothetical protein
MWHGNRQFVTCLLPWLPAFHPTPVCVGFVVYKVVLGQALFSICSFPLFIIIHSVFSFTVDQLCGILVIDSNTEYLKHTHQGDRRGLWLQSTDCYSQDQDSPVHCRWPAPCLELQVPPVHYYIVPQYLILCQYYVTNAPYSFLHPSLLLSNHSNWQHH